MKTWVSVWRQTPSEHQLACTLTLKQVRSKIPPWSLHFYSIPFWTTWVAHTAASQGPTSILKPSLNPALLWSQTRMPSASQQHEHYRTHHFLSSSTHMTKTKASRFIGSALPVHLTQSFSPSFLNAFFTWPWIQLFLLSFRSFGCFSHLPGLYTHWNTPGLQPQISSSLSTFVS